MMKKPFVHLRKVHNYVKRDMAGNGCGCGEGLHKLPNFSVQNVRAVKVCTSLSNNFICGRVNIFPVITPEP